MRSSNLLCKEDDSLIHKFAVLYFEDAVSYYDTLSASRAVVIIKCFMRSMNL